MQYLRHVHYVIKILLIVLLITLIGLVSLQVFARFLLPRAPSWTEELARFTMLFLVSFGAGLAFYKDMFISVDIVLSKRNSNTWYYFLLKMLVHIIIAFTMIVLLLYSVPMIKVGIRQTSAVLFIPMCIVFSSMMIMPFTIVTAQLYQLYNYLKKYKK